MLAHEGLNLCAKTRATIIDPSTSKQKTPNVKIYIGMNKIIEKLKLMFLNISILYSCKSDLSITSYEEEILMHLMLNMVKNSKNAHSTIISINVTQETQKIIIIVKDNGCGMQQDVVSGFFSRTLPENHNCLQIEENRGEGMLLSSMKWKQIGGEITLNSEVGVGTTFEMKINGTISTVTSLTPENIDTLQNLKHKKIILLVDDSLVNLKMIIMEICKHVKKKMSDFRLPQVLGWEHIGCYVIEDLVDATLIFTSNGEYAFDIYQLVKCDYVITDLEMPVMSGYDLIKRIVEIKKNQTIIVNSATDKENFFQKLELCPIDLKLTFTTKGTYMNMCEILCI
jgi:CheY-like chemotaxis protein/anti-sigma regulatory factor (Ser/Thr protein kinase)